MTPLLATPLQMWLAGLIALAVLVVAYAIFNPNEW